MSFAIPEGVLQTTRNLMEQYRFDTEGSVAERTLVPDDSGGYTYTDTASITFPMGIATGLKGQQQLEQRLLDRIGNKPYFIIVTAIDVDIQLEDVIVETGTNRRFRVLAIENKGITLQMVQRVNCIEEFTNNDD